MDMKQQQNYSSTKLKPVIRETEIRGSEALQPQHSWQMRRPWRLSNAAQSVAKLRKRGQ